jgi:hypothetical protein
MYELGRQLVREMRGNFEAGDLDDDSATGSFPNRFDRVRCWTVGWKY